MMEIIWKLRENYDFTEITNTNEQKVLSNLYKLFRTTVLHNVPVFQVPAIFLARFPLSRWIHPTIF